MRGVQPTRSKYGNLVPPSTPMTFGAVTTCYNVGPSDVPRENLPGDVNIVYWTSTCADACDEQEIITSWVRQLIKQPHFGMIVVDMPYHAAHARRGAILPDPCRGAASHLAEMLETRVKDIADWHIWAMKLPAAEFGVPLVGGRVAMVAQSTRTSPRIKQRISSIKRFPMRQYIELDNVDEASADPVWRRVGLPPPLTTKAASTLMHAVRVHSGNDEVKREPMMIDTCRVVGSVFGLQMDSGPLYRCSGRPRTLWVHVDDGMGITSHYLRPAERCKLFGVDPSLVVMNHAQAAQYFNLAQMSPVPLIGSLLMHVMGGSGAELHDDVACDVASSKRQRRGRH
jgi:hypothetical protein